jgi:SAM-dependent methyltransferase
LKRRPREAARHYGRQLSGTALDLVDRARGRRDPLLPPRRLLSGDYSDFQRIGQRFLQYFVELAGLEPQHRVLDVGCGVGRMAVPLMGYLSDRGTYDGFDVVSREVEWCEREITPRRPSFRFRLVDVHNARYNPTGTVAPAEFEWPYPDASFDLVLASSVFTHLRPDAADRYLGEAARVLRPGGALFATYFLLDELTRGLAAAGRSHYSFTHGAGPAWSTDPAVFEAAVAYELDHIHARHDHHGIPIETLRRGEWSGAGDALTWQDVVVARTRLIT